MPKFLFILSLLSGLYDPDYVTAQKNYTDSMLTFRKNYKEEFIREERSPLKGKDTAFLRFYPVKTEYCIMAELELTPDAPAFEMLTHNGKKQAYRQYAVARFLLKGIQHKLNIYQNISLIQKEGQRDHLFLPFNDLTNYETTYAGGRYIDLSTGNVQQGKIRIDFNKCYNPYCAFKSGYSCPVPPVENRLQVRIEAGEKLFGKKLTD